MSKASKEPANDLIPEDEMFLAKIIQNAAARKFRSTVKTLYRGKNGRILVAPNKIGAPRGTRLCCAVGAQYLEADTNDYNYDGIPDGNDGRELLFDGNKARSGYTVGQSFRHALR